MVDDGYRSYVVRVRRHRAPGGAPDGMRLEVEDLLGGRRAAVGGERARRVADGLAALIDKSAGSHPDRGDGGPRPLR